MGDHSNHAAGHCLARQCYSSVILNGTLLRRYFALGYILAFFLYMLLMWAILRRTGCLQRKHLLVLGLLPLVTGIFLVGIVDWLAPDVHNHSLDVCNIEPFSAFDKDSKIWRPLEGYFSFNGGCADVASFLRSVCCVPTRASLELSKSQLAIPVCICPADLGPQHWPTFAGLLHLVFPFGMGGSNADCGQGSICD